MKKLWTVLIMILFLINFSFAQEPLQMGSKIIHGGVSFTSTSYEHSTDSYNILSITPGMLYFMMDNLALGADLLYQRSSHGDWNTSTFGVGPAVRYYFPMGNNNPFVSVGFTYTSSSSSDSNESMSNTLFSFGGGTDFMVAQNVAIEPFAMYHLGSSSYSGSSSSYSILEIGIGITSFLGN